jgi:hypothetical protein
MAYSPHTLVAFGGPLTTLSPGDQWQCGVRVRMLDPDGISWRGGAVDPAAYMAAIQAALLAWFKTAAVTTAGSENLGMRNDATLAWLKVNNIDAAGHYASNVSHRFDYAAAQTGVIVANALPPFVTAAVSWLTAIQRGPGHRGRVYLPLGLASLHNTGQMTVTEQTQCNGTGKRLLDVLKNFTDTSGTAVPVVASGINGATNTITGIATGNVYDVQRRRKEQIPETYVSRTYP